MHVPVEWFGVKVRRRARTKDGHVFGAVIYRWLNSTASEQVEPGRWSNWAPRGLEVSRFRLGRRGWQARIHLHTPAGHVGLQTIPKRLRELITPGCVAHICNNIFELWALVMRNTILRGFFF